MTPSFASTRVVLVRMKMRMRTIDGSTQYQLLVQSRTEFNSLKGNRCSRAIETVKTMCSFERRAVSAAMHERSRYRLNGY